MAAAARVPPDRERVGWRRARQRSARDDGDGDDADRLAADGAGGRGGGRCTPRRARACGRSTSARCRPLVQDTARELHVPGAVVLLRTPQGKFTATYGTTRVGRPDPAAPDTHFRIASITKTMTSAVVLQLAQEGKLRLGDPVSKYVRRRAER